MSIFSEIAHVALIVHNYSQVKAFYVDKLGFSIIRENYREQTNDWKLDLRCGNCELEIFGKPDAPKRPSGAELCGYRHLAFRVADVNKAIEELAKKGIVCDPVRIDAYTHNGFTFLRDPEGNVIELHE
ncbi:MAG: VOC family protein [Acetivibrionales bacterium]|jgi:glyoxylase I family protein